MAKNRGNGRDFSEVDGSALGCGEFLEQLGCGFAVAEARVGNFDVFIVPLSPLPLTKEQKILIGLFASMLAKVMKFST